MGVPLTSKRSIAVDPMSIPLGYPLYISTSDPVAKMNWIPLLYQDTGGAIKSLRGDLLGSGTEVFAGKWRTKLKCGFWKF